MMANGDVPGVGDIWGVVGVVGQNEDLFNSFQRSGGSVSQRHRRRNFFDSLLIEQQLECSRKFRDVALSKSLKDVRKSF